MTPQEALIVIKCALFPEPLQAMTPQEALTIIGWSHRELARRAGCSATHARRMATGRIPMPPDLLEWLRRLIAPHAEPCPVCDWSNPASFAVIPYHARLKARGALRRSRYSAPK